MSGCAFEARLESKPLKEEKTIQVSLADAGVETEFTQLSDAPSKMRLFNTEIDGQPAVFGMEICNRLEDSRSYEALSFALKNGGTISYSSRDVYKQNGITQICAHNITYLPQ